MQTWIPNGAKCAALRSVRRVRASYALIACIDCARACISLGVQISWISAMRVQRARAGVPCRPRAVPVPCRVMPCRARACRS